MAEAQRKVRRIPLIEDLDANFNKVLDELTAAHIEAVETIGEKGNDIQKSMAAILTTTSTIEAMTMARGMAELADSVRVLTQIVSTMADRFGVKPPSGISIN